MQSYSLRDLYFALTPDAWRRTNAFSADMAAAQEVLFDSYATRSDCELQLMRWMQRYQSCVFGRVAAARSYLHVAVLTDTDFQTRSDQEIAALIGQELLIWKRRSLRPTPDFSTPAHGFILAAVSPRLANAAPDAHLLAFSQKLRELWGCKPSQEAVGEVYWETLYLRHPEEARTWRFTFSVDFFGAQGDGRWWHDHRAPGGLLFTANSVGHMRRYRELYEGKAGDQTAWVVQSAMKTIEDASITKWGKATWLKDLGRDGRPVVPGVACPFADYAGSRAALSGRDWTRYGGYLHSDHSIRPEFFRADAAPSEDITRQEHLQDFTYLYDARLRDHAAFMGVEVSEQEVEEALGPVSSWTAIPRGRRVVAPEPAPATRGGSAPDFPDTGGPSVRVGAEMPVRGAVPDRDERARLDALLNRSAVWELSSAELAGLDPI